MKITHILRSNYFFARVASILVSFHTPFAIKSEIENSILHFPPHGEQSKKKIVRDMIFSKIYFQMSPEEYLRYDFENLSFAGRRQYVSNRELTRKFSELETKEMHDLFRNKYSAYLEFRNFYKRKIVLIKNQEDLRGKKNEILDMGSRIIAKPLALSGGRGVKLIDLSRTDWENYICDLCADSGCIIEAVIAQDERMARFHPQSVNTVRIVTHNQDKPRIVMASVRLGMGDSVVDNGCLSAAIDIHTGLITTPGRNAHSRGLFLYHPDTNEQILGEKIPEWDSVVELAIELSSKVPKQRIIGWDFALSTDGWVIVEGNTRPEIQILAGAGVGVRQLFEEITAK